MRGVWRDKLRGFYFSFAKGFIAGLNAVVEPYAGCATLAGLGVALGVLGLGLGRLGRGCRFGLLA
jgi:hypothetical protein